MDKHDNNNDDDEIRPNWWMGVAALLFLVLCGVTYFILVLAYAKLLPGG